MNKELIQKWVDWLRDPKNKQTSNVLCTINPTDPSDKCNCCLGGLAELYLASKGLPVEWRPSGNGADVQVISINQVESTQLLPDELFDELGISPSFHFRQLPKQYTLRAEQYIKERGWSRDMFSYDFLNDNLKFTFLEIADCIEHMYLKDGKEDSSNKAV